MKQLLQSLKTGELEVAEVPEPACLPGRVLVRTAYSFISPGTERASRRIAKSSLISKARERPDQVRKTLQKIRTEGIRSTLEKVRTRLEEPVPLGYSCSGIVIESGEGVQGFHPGEKVSCAGAGYANHAEIVSVPKNLVAKVPDGVTLEEASGATLCAIALQGLRVGDIRIGEIVGVIGLGLIGQITVQLLKACGCRVLGIDLNPKLRDLATEMGADEAVLRTDPVEEVAASMTGGHGLDAVLVCAATESKDPIELAGILSRKKGRVVAVGTVPLEVPRRVYYPKELDLRLSTSYGPGRYDPNYEEKGIDYPYAYVRFTEQRNLVAALSLMQEGKIHLSRLIQEKFPVDEAEMAYARLENPSSEPLIGLLFEYPSTGNLETPSREIPRPMRILPSEGVSRGTIRVGLLGAGRFAGGVLLPILKRINGVYPVLVVTSRGATAKSVAQRFSIPRASCRADDLFEDPEIDVAVIATRHGQHSSQVIQALHAGKNVFVEKPLALREEDLHDLEAAVTETGKVVMVGFNRRFAPLSQRIKDWFSPRNFPLTITVRVQAGRLEEGSWLRDPKEGGGRIIGEVCHFLDLFQFWTDSRIERLVAGCINAPEDYPASEDNIAVVVEMRDGSVASLVYTSEGSEILAKERYELHGGRKSAILDDFRRLELYEAGKKKVVRTRTQDKGHRRELEHFFECIREGVEPSLTFAECVNTTRATFEIVRQLRSQTY